MNGFPFKLPDPIYNVIKWVIALLLPGIATLYSELAPTWDLPYPEAIPFTIMKITFFLGVIMGISQLAYNKEQNEE